MSKLFTEVSVEQQEIVSGGFGQLKATSAALAAQEIITAPIAATPNTFAAVPVDLRTLEASRATVEIN